MTVRRVTLKIVGDDAQVRRMLDELQAKKDRIAGRATIRVVTDTSNATLGLDRLGLKLDRLSRSVISLNVKDKAAKAALDEMRKKLLLLHDKDWRARVGVEEYNRTKAELDEIERKLKEIKRTGDSIRLKGLTGRGGFLGLIGKVLPGIGGAAGGAAGGAGEGGGGLLGSLGTPQGLAALAAVTAAVAALSSLVPALAGLLATGAVGGGGIIAGLLGNPGQLKQFKAELSGILASVAAAAKPLTGAFVGAFGQLGKFIKGEGPQLKSMFNAAIPGIRMFTGFLAQAGKVLIPAFTQTLREMKPFLPEMSKAMLQVVKAFGYFLKDLGPGMGSSSRIWLASATALKGIAIGLSAAIEYMSTTLVAVGHAVRISWHWISNFFKWNQEGWPKIGRFIGGIWHSTWEGINAVQHAIGGAVISGAKGVWKGLVWTWQNIRASAVSIWHGVYAAIVSPLEAAWRFVSRIVGDIEGALSRIGGAISGVTGALGSLGGIAGSIGHLFGLSAAFTASSPSPAAYRAPRVTNIASGYSAITAPPRAAQQRASAPQPVINVYVSGAMDANAVARQVQTILLNLKRDRGGGALGLA
jgi:hypothetical protein